MQVDLTADEVEYLENLIGSTAPLATFFVIPAGPASSVYRKLTKKEDS